MLMVHNRYCLELDLPDYVHEHASITQIKHLTAETIQLYDCRLPVLVSPS
jgi:hypothetical protein